MVPTDVPIAVETKQLTIKSTATVNLAGIIESIKRSRQGEKFMRLHEGNLQGYESESNAVQAYIDILNYFTAGDKEIITEVLKMGYFADTKHSGDAYITRSIEKARQTDQNPRNESILKKRKRIREYGSKAEGWQSEKPKGRRRV